MELSLDSLIVTDAMRRVIDKIPAAKKSLGR
jgi:hypothetical protein